MSYEQTSIPKAELNSYADGYMERLYRDPGARFSLGFLRDTIAEPVLNDVGTVYVQTVYNGKQRGFFFDFDHMIEYERPDSVVDLSEFPTDDVVHDITLGEEWNSPLGTVGRVVGVALPYITGARQLDRDHMIDCGDKRPPTIVGRQQIDAAVVE